jgi:hypothetical protein
MDPREPGSSNPDQQGAATSNTNQATTGTQTGTLTANRATAARTRTAADGEPAAPKAQSEIGPTSFVEGGAVIQHDENDPITKDAYKLGHPADGIAQQHDRNPPPALQLQDRARSDRQQGQPGAQSRGDGQSGQPGGTRKVQMLRDEAEYSGGQTIDVPADRAQQLIDSGAARAV